LRFRARGICRYVVDLHDNYGGDMLPMISGVDALLGAPPYGYWDSGDGDLAPWPVFHKPFVPDGKPVADFAPIAPRQDGAFVAVLVNRYTVSAGEFTAIAFEGRARTRGFAENTGG